MTQFLLKIQSGTEDISSHPISSGQTGLGLDIDGVTCQSDNSPVHIAICNQELQITRSPVFSQEITILRNGRKRTLLTGQSVRLLAKDQIEIGSKAFTIQSITPIYVPHSERILKSLKTSGRALILGSASALALTACGPTIKGNQITGAVAVVAPADSESADTHTDAVPSDEPQADASDAVESPVAPIGDPYVVEENRLTDSVADIPCDDKEGIDRKVCCEAITDFNRLRERMDCCDYLERDTGLKCEELPVRTAGEPPVLENNRE